MRVISGSARRLLLKTIEGNDTRPTTDRLKETLFNMLQYQIAGCRFLDLFSGSGAIGIEALSRGAKGAVFVEQNPRAVSCIKDNLKTTGLENCAVVIEADVFAALKELEGREENHAFDFIFMDPPYNHQYEQQVLKYLSDSKLADSSTKVIIEASKETDLNWISSFGWQIDKIKMYKTNQHIFTTKGE
ncbi:MAG: 16S rRNA (guanine(966)-N(2))-methyltransferase RsmD [Lachnospiraceae bacterium]|jgi:16S rRNA (guanine966-N2)-methyltransferase|nr:16S rRNA (guanine(966)-N(2))-methyltransferase RsmD [Lachnospiraceae bacterium]